MKSFAFNLEKILDLKEYNEDEAKIELGRAIGILTDLENRILVLGRERIRAATAQFSPGNNAALIQQYMFYIIRLDNTKERLVKEAALAEIKVEEARQAYIEASRERNVLDKLKEKRQKEYKKEMLIAETKILDEIPASHPAKAHS